MSLNESEWFTECFENLTAFSVRYSQRLYKGKSAFQTIEVYETERLGRVLILDGCFMVTEADTFIYHEMLVHPAMTTVDRPRKVLVIGGGDGGAVTEIVKYPEVESCTLCEIDPMVVEVCRNYFPSLSAGLDDPRVTVVNEDGAEFVKRFRQEFDAVFVDSTDPVGPGEVLFQHSFYESIKGALCPTGVAVFQTESPLFMKQVFADAVKNLRRVFGRNHARPYFATIPSYPGGLWSFTYCSLTERPVGQSAFEMRRFLRGHLAYYNEAIHKAAFALPEFAAAMLAE
ncbi:MAG: polyamine aminopropyltransferase [Desulfomonilaceae bacterium]